MKPLLKVIYLPSLLLILWLVLNDSLSLGQILLGSVLAIILSLLAPILRPVKANLAKPITELKLIKKVITDIAISNYKVGIRIIDGDKANAKPGIIEIPLTITDPHGLAALSCIITFTPGTVWAGHDSKTNILRLHVLDIKDNKSLIKHIQKHYEQPLLEIFQ